MPHGSACANCNENFEGTPHHDGTNPGDSYNEYFLCDKEDCKKSVLLICGACSKKYKYCHKCVQEKKDGDNIMCPCGGMAEIYDMTPGWDISSRKFLKDYFTLRSGKNPSSRKP